MAASRSVADRLATGLVAFAALVGAGVIVCVSAAGITWVNYQGHRETRSARAAADLLEHSVNMQLALGLPIADVLDGLEHEDLSPNVDWWVIARSENDLDITVRYEEESKAFSPQLRGRMCITMTIDPVARIASYVERGCGSHDMPSSTRVVP